MLRACACTGAHHTGDISLRATSVIVWFRFDVGFVIGALHRCIVYQLSYTMNEHHDRFMRLHLPGLLHALPPDDYVRHDLWDRRQFCRIIRRYHTLSSCEVVRRFLELHCSIRPALVYRHFVFPTYFNQVQLVPPSGFGVGV